MLLKGMGDMTFALNQRFLTWAKTTQARAVLWGMACAALSGAGWLLVDLQSPFLQALSRVPYQLPDMAALAGEGVFALVLGVCVAALRWGNAQHKPWIFLGLCFYALCVPLCGLAFWHLGRPVDALLIGALVAAMAFILSKPIQRSMPWVGWVLFATAVWRTYWVLVLYGLVLFN